MKVINFEDFIKQGRKDRGTSENDLPWAFEYEGINVTHENDNKYLLGAKNGIITFNRGEILVTIDGVAYTKNPNDADFTEYKLS